MCIAAANNYENCRQVSNDLFIILGETKYEYFPVVTSKTERHSSQRFPLHLHVPPRAPQIPQRQRIQRENASVPIRGHITSRPHQEF